MAKDDSWNTFTLCPEADTTKRETIRDLDRIRIERGDNLLEFSVVANDSITAAAWEHHTWECDLVAILRHLAMVVDARDDVDKFVAIAKVSAAKFMERCLDTAGVWSIEIGNVNDSHATPISAL